MNISQPQPVNETLIIEMPDGMALGFNPSSEDFDWSDVLPSNYWSMEALGEKYKDTGKWPVYTPSHLKIQPILDPEKKDHEQDYSAKLVMYFKESSPGLVLNKSRCQLMSEITGTRNPAKWLTLLKGQIVLKTGILNDKAQILFEVFAPVVEGPAGDQPTREAIDFDQLRNPTQATGKKPAYADDIPF